MYQWFEGQSTKYDPDELLEKMINKEQYDIEGTRGFADNKKAEAFQAYKQISVNPDINWFEGQWAQHKQAEDQKIANELMNDYRLGKISEKEFNLASRDEKFQDWYRKSKLEDPTLGGQYDPTYETASEWLLGRKGSTGAAGKNIIERNPIKTALGLASIPFAGYTAGAYQAGKKAVKAGEKVLTTAQEKAKGYKGKYEPIEKLKDKGLTLQGVKKNPKFEEYVKKTLKKDFKNANTADWNKFSEHNYNTLKKQADAGVKSAQDKMKLLEKKGLIKKVGKLWTKLPGFARGIGMFGALLAAEPIAKGVTRALGGSEKTAETSGLAVRTGIGGRIAYSQAKSTAMNALKKAGAPRMADNFGKIIKRKGWKWIAKTAAKKSPGLVAKIFAKAGIGGTLGTLSGGVFAGVMGYLTIRDLASLINVLTEESGINE
jgi:hypothetical protein